MAAAAVLSTVPLGTEASANVGAAPGGAVDGCDAQSIWGWTKDPDFAGSLSVHVYRGGPAGTGAFVTQQVAAEASEPATGGSNQRFHIGHGQPPGTRLFVHTLGVDAAGAQNHDNPVLSRSSYTTTECVVQNPARADGLVEVYPADPQALQIVDAVNIGVVGPDEATDTDEAAEPYIPDNARAGDVLRFRAKDSAGLVQTRMFTVVDFRDYSVVLPSAHGAGVASGSSAWAVSRIGHQGNPVANVLGVPVWLAGYGLGFLTGGLGSAAQATFQPTKVLFEGLHPSASGVNSRIWDLPGLWVPDLTQPGTGAGFVQPIQKVGP